MNAVDPRAVETTPTLDERMQRFVRPDLQSMHGYAVQPSAGLIKLDTMENPFALPTALREALGRRLAEVPLNRYPAERGEVLRERLAAYAQMPEGCDIVLGNGSDELITLLAMACDMPGACVVAPVPGFVMYQLAAQLQGLSFVGVATTPDFELDRAAMLQAIADHRPALIYIAYPNNPTANLWNDQDIEAVIEASSGFVVIDEAYQPFSRRDSRAWLTRYSHVLLMRTMSKFGLAGVRIGYLIGQQSLIAQINKVRPPFNVSVLNCEAALFALEHAEEYERQAQVIRQQRERLQQAFAVIDGVQAFPSEANMILVRVKDAASTFERMKAQGVLVKNVSALHPLLANCLRITVGTPDENERLLTAFNASLND